MPILSLERLTEYRAATYRLRPDLRVTTREQAIAFVNQRGFVHFWPVKGVTLPSLWAAVAGDRPVPNEHDDPGHVTWGWKDELLGARRWYYAKVLRKKATFIALDVVPTFYALSENYDEPAEDYLLQYQEGCLTFEAKTVYETLLDEGPLDSISLRKLSRLSSRESESRFNRALEMLQADFKILPVGVAQAGAWKYAFIYDLVQRFYPDLPEQARPIRVLPPRRRTSWRRPSMPTTGWHRHPKVRFPGSGGSADIACLARRTARAGCKGETAGGRPDCAGAGPAWS